MKQKMQQRISQTIIATILVLTLLVGGAQPIEAATAPSFPVNDDYEFMFSPEWDSFGLCVGNVDKKAKVKVTVSDKKLATVKWDSKQNIAFVTAKKPCTVKVSFKIVQKGKTYKHSTKLTWTKYKNPLKSLKIGSKNYNVKYFDKNTQAAMKKVTGNKAVTVKLKSGYKITGIGFSRGGVYKNIKNGSKIRFNKSGKENTVLFINYIDSKNHSGVLRLFADDKDGKM